MQLRPYQQDAVRAVITKWQEFKRLLLVMPTGTGKTVVFSDIARRQVEQGRRVLILAHRDELIRQAADKLGKATGLGCAVEKAAESARDSMYMITVGSVQTLTRAKRREQFPRDYYDTIIVDEAHHCCPAGTLVDGLPIESLTKGDMVTAFDHASGRCVSRPVTATMRRRTDTICRVVLASGGSFRCTPDHPVWNGQEYVDAIRLSCNDMVHENIHNAEDVRDLRDGLPSEVVELKDDAILFAGMRPRSVQTPQKEDRGFLPGVRQADSAGRIHAAPSAQRTSLLFQEVQPQSACEVGIGHDGRDQSQVCLAADARTEPDAGPGSKGSNGCGSQGASISEPARQRACLGATAAAIRRAFDLVAGLFRAGVANLHRRRQGSVSTSSECLQGGHWTRQKQGGHRGGRTVTPTVQAKAGRRIQGSSLAGVRVARVEVYERGRGPEFERLCPGGVVYNLEVEHNNNFFADGILVHNCLSESYQRVLAYWGGAQVVGVTATPDRGDKKNLGKYFDDLAFEYSVRDAIDAGYLCRIQAQTIPLDIDISSVRTTAGDYNDKDLGNALDPYLGQIADQMATVCADRKTLVFLPLIATSQKMVQFLRDRGIRAQHIDGTSGDRTEILRDYGAGRYQVLCNSMLLTEGYDEPSVDCVVCLRPTKIRSLYAQIVGRGTRILPGKNDLLILDFLWHTAKHDLCHPASLIADSEEIAVQMQLAQEKAGGPVDLEAMEVEAKKEVRHQREEALARELKEHQRKKRKTVDPIAFALSLHADDLLDYEPTFSWQSHPASDKQLSALARFGFEPESIPNKGYASMLLDKVINRSRQNMATPKQVRLLEQYGHDTASEMSFQEAKIAIDTIAKNGWRKIA